MTFEAITTLVHVHMYDRLNESNNSNDGQEMKHVEERPYKRKLTEKSDQDRPKIDRKIQDTNNETTAADNAAHQIGQENTIVRQKQLKVETAKAEDTTRSCAQQ